MYETSNDLSPTTRRSMIELLNDHLADANFVGLHDLFDRVAAQAQEYADEIAERAEATSLDSMDYAGACARGPARSLWTRFKVKCALSA